MNWSTTISAITLSLKLLRTELATPLNPEGSEGHDILDCLEQLSESGVGNRLGEKYHS